MSYRVLSPISQTRLEEVEMIKTIVHLGAHATLAVFLTYVIYLGVNGQL